MHDIKKNRWKKTQLAKIKRKLRENEKKGWIKLPGKLEKYLFLTNLNPILLIMNLKMNKKLDLYSWDCIHELGN